MEFNREEKKKQFLKIYDSEMRRELHAEVLLDTLTTLSKIIQNIISAPNEEKFRKIPATNKMLNEKVLERKGGKTFLLACGFIKKTIEEKDYWYLNLTPATVPTLELARDEVVDKRKKEFLDAVEAERKRDLKEKEDYQKRAEKVKRDFEEDRATWELKVEMTGGVKDSVAQEFPDREVRVGRGPRGGGGGGGGAGLFPAAAGPGGGGAMGGEGGEHGGGQVLEDDD